MKMSNICFSNISSNTVHQNTSWMQPSEEGKYMTGLCVHNSMTANIIPFIPQVGRSVGWYGCGPTVYDAAHMGHARNYVTFDILRRIMTDYFGYDVQMVMNVTDIDDKIIKQSIENNIHFKELAAYWEDEFWKDMESLNVKLPSTITRVSEHMDEIIELIKQIMKNGFAYESEGSVYFDTEKFTKSDKHVYGRLEPSSVQQAARVLEGEGELGYTSTEKRSACDFALWKKSKENEPYWNSPWGDGRPGWHIECSAMAAKNLSFPLDIHSGGVDLRFPHHDNELAQSEAAFDKPQWVNYFLHSGHLNIEGAKMSKSLKNFITIKEILKRYNARHIRFLCLLNRWDAPMNYNPCGETMNEATEIDNFFGTFFDTVRSLTSHYDSKVIQKWSSIEYELNTLMHQTKSKVHDCLCDNFNTAGAVVSLRRLASEMNSYVNKYKMSELKIPIVVEIAEYVHTILTVFGIIPKGSTKWVYGEAATKGEQDDGIVKCLAGFRNEVRNMALETIKSGDVSTNEKERMKKLLALCDELRDVKMLDLAVQLDDRADGTYVIRHISQEEAMSTKENKERELKEKLEKKEEKQKALAMEAARKAERDSVEPSEYFKVFHSDLYSAIDETGIPIAMKNGDEISKSHRKWITKTLEKHVKNHNKWLEVGKEQPVKDE